MKKVVGLIVGAGLLLAGGGVAVAELSTAPSAVTAAERAVLTVHTVGVTGDAISTIPRGTVPAPPAPASSTEEAGVPAPSTPPVPAPASAPVDSAPASADGRLSIGGVGFSEAVAEEIRIGPEGGTIRPEGRGLAQAHVDGFEAGQLYVIHSGGAPENAGNLLVERDADSPTVPVGTEVNLPDGGLGVVTRSEVSPKDDIPEWVWTGLADGQVVLVTCRPESSSPARSSSNAIILIERT